eukprot:CAMPEP_0176090244 /NCGR_PEP_ID=MMETSP0120_2-20121206/45195_1 /TAXON_ID=160619 /ORGANISM="Kryptoperidinium foliaceum, Strain CCMP 1326" /LENGTH=147 /DNA_ID=CAMNT_0017424123 /DNA_START=65 /DNA_END=504 /DNA_ORIENTATION=-
MARAFLSRRLLPPMLAPRPTAPPANLWGSRPIASTSFRGPIQEYIEDKLRKFLRPVHMDVANESHGGLRNESHFHVVVVSDAFEGLSRIARHRMVSRLFTDEEGSLKFHALRITAVTPQQWSDSPETGARPRCTGHGDGRDKATDAA